MLAQYSKITYFDFDEIDTGVSGELRLGWEDYEKRWSQDMQILLRLLILPPTAKGDARPQVFKSTVW
jgi:hypothetical protein